MEKLKNFMQKYVKSYLKRKELKSLFAMMTSHVNNCPLESSLKYRKLEKLLKLEKTGASLAITVKSNWYSVALDEFGRLSSSIIMTVDIPSSVFSGAV